MQVREDINSSRANAQTLARLSHALLSLQVALQDMGRAKDFTLSEDGRAYYKGKINIVDSTYTTKASKSPC